MDFVRQSLGPLGQRFASVVMLGAFTGLAYAGLMCCWPAVASGQFGARPAEEETFLMAPRVLSRLLREGEAAISDGRFAEGVVLLGAVLQEDSEDIPEDLRGQDFFVDPGSRGLYQTSVKGEAIRLMSLLPEEGRQTLELQFGVTARNDLDKAIQNRDFAAIAEVARKYIHTAAGYDAQLLIAEQKLVQGYPLAAANIFQNLLDFPAARARYGVGLVEAAAMAWLQADNRDMAQATLQQAANDFQGSSVTIAGRQLPLTASTDWASGLDQWQTALRSMSVANSTDTWLVAGGSPQRNAESRVSLPMRNARWVKEIHSSVPERDAMLEVEETNRKSGNVILPKFELRMIDDTILTKTTDAGVLGIDFETGNIKWVHYFGSSAAPLRSISWNRNLMGDDIVSRELQKRVWGSSAFGRFSCDRERFYYISSDGEQPIDAATLFSGTPVGVGTNYLEGVSIAAQGAIEWRVGGTTGQDDPRLAGAYFLGPPLAFEGELYALAEQNGEIRLLALEPATGQLIWQQQLAQANSMPIVYDELRRCQALSPTIADGVVLCPTGVGAVAAVDLLSRSLLWGATYRASQSNGMSPFRGGAFGMTLPEFQPLARRWDDNAMIAAQGRLVVSPPDSEVVFCRDTLTGESRLASHPRRNSRYVAGLRGNQLILVGETNVTAVGMIDKRIAWEFTFPNDLTLAGKGLWQGDSMLIPLSGQRVIHIDLDNGALLGQVEVDQPLGNLFAYRDQLLSVTSTAISAFYTRDALQIQVQERLAQNPQDPWALNQKSQLLLAEGKLDDSIELLKESYAVDSENPDTKYFLVETMLKAMESDFEQYSTLANDLNGVVQIGSQRFPYLQQLALGSIRAGQHLNAFQRLMELMEDRMSQLFSGNPARSSQIKLDQRHAVDSDTWIATALSQAYQAASEEDRQAMDKMVAVAMQRVEGTAIPLRRQRLQYLQWLPASADSALELARELLVAAEQTTAEQVLQPLLHIGSKQHRQQALELLARPAAADVNYFGPYGRSYPLADQMLDPRPVLPGTVLPAEPAGADRDIVDKLPPEVVWHAGMLEHETTKEFAFFPVGRRIEMSGERYGRPEFSVSLSDSLLAVFNNNGESVGSLSYTAASSDITNAFTRAECRGGLLMLETASEVVAFDVYRGMGGEDSPQLWRHSLVGAAPEEQFVAAQFLQPTAPLGIVLPKRQVPNMAVVNVGPLTPATQIVQSGSSIHGLDLLTGRKVWTRDGYGENVRMAVQGLNLAIVSPAEGNVQVVDCRDGHLVRESEYRGDLTPWLSHGEHLVDFQPSTTNGKSVIRAWNPFTSETLVEVAVAASARASECEHRYVVIADPAEDQLVYIDLGTGVVKQLELDIDRDLANVGVVRFQDKIVAFAQPTARARQQIGTPTEDAVGGFLLALDAQTGQPLWERAARLQGMTFPKAQPRNSPFLVLYRFEPGNLPTFASCLLLDLRDGSIALSDRRYLTNSPGFHMRLQPLNQRIDLSVGDRSYKLQMTTEPAPPRPVAHFGFDNVRRGAGGSR